LGGAPALPVTPEVFIARFSGSEGITFNGQGQLFIGADHGIWIAEPNGAVRKIADVDESLGQAGIGGRDILAADFGPTDVFEHGPNDDGVVWRVTPEGQKSVAARGIADPNFVLVLRDGSFLVSDDGTDKIYRVAGGVVSVWSTAVAYPNGLALSLDEKTLYVAQIFLSLDPFLISDRLWALRVEDGSPERTARLVARMGGGGIDGLATDEHGRIYVADNGAGKIWRVDPRSRAVVLVAEGMPHVASLVFGEGRFERTSLYATSTGGDGGGGRIWKVPVGVRGAEVVR
jgi:sugar lactone lactonase YvrE